MAEKMTEILSRYLDDDLEDSEVERLEERLRSDPALAAELEALQAIQRSIASLATQERPPSELDQIVEPLLLGRPSPTKIRPWARWLATAAAVVLGVTVVFEVNRSQPGEVTQVSRQGRSATSSPQSSERFSLAPLPTSSLSEEEQPLGATDRILASPIPDVALDDPPALEVIGPLEKDARKVETEERERTTSEASVTAFADAAQEQKEMSSGLELKEDDADNTGDEGIIQAPAPWENPDSATRGQLYVFMEGETAWQNFETETRCQSGRYAVRIGVSNGVVRDVWPVGIPPAAPSQRLCAAEIIFGLKVEDVSDGEYAAEVVVERRGTRN